MIVDDVTMYWVQGTHKTSVQFLHFVVAVVEMLVTRLQLVVNVKKSGSVAYPSTFAKRIAAKVSKVGFKLRQWIRDLGHDACGQKR